MSRPKRRQEVQKYTTEKLHNSPVCNRLNELINENNQKEFCKALGITDRTVYHWKKGQSRPDIDKLADIANFFKVTTDYLTGRIDIPAPTQDLVSICEYTGLSEQALKELNATANMAVMMHEEEKLVNNNYKHFLEAINALICHNYHCRSIGLIWRFLFAPVAGVKIIEPPLPVPPEFENALWVNNNSNGGERVLREAELIDYRLLQINNSLLKLREALQKEDNRTDSHSDG